MPTAIRKQKKRESAHSGSRVSTALARENGISYSALIDGL